MKMGITQLKMLVVKDRSKGSNRIANTAGKELNQLPRDGAFSGAYSVEG